MVGVEGAEGRVCGAVAVSVTRRRWDKVFGGRSSVVSSEGLVE